MATLGENLHPIDEQGRVAAELVDDEAADEALFVHGKQPERPEELGEDAAAVDVADEEDGGIQVAGNGHVDDVGRLQVQLGRAAGALDDQEVEPDAEAVERLDDRRPEGPLALVVLAGRHRPPGVAMNNHLRAVVGLGLEEDRVHVDVGLDPRGERLERLSPADLAAVGADGGVVRHVLRLERRDADAPAGEDPAEGRHQQALADR